MPRTVNLEPLRGLLDALGICLNFSADALWPRRCHLCEAPGALGLDLCAPCAGALPWMPPACPRCARPTDAAGQTCVCELLPSSLDSVTAAFLYKAPMDHWIPRLKFHGDLAMAALLASLMAERTVACASPEVVLVPIPLHTPRLRERGYNQALELARPLAREVGVRLDRTLLKRCKPTQAQSELGLEARALNLADAFEVCAHAPPPPHVVLVDDVMTTGATLEEAAACLKDAGVARVDAWVCARVA